MPVSYSIEILRCTYIVHCQKVKTMMPIPNGYQISNVSYAFNLWKSRILKNQLNKVYFNLETCSLLSILDSYIKQYNVHLSFCLKNALTITIKCK